MSRRRSRDPSARALLAGNSATRFTDLRVQFVDERDNATILDVGGRWDKKRKDWALEDARTCLQIRVHPGQIQVVEWFGEWLRAYLSGDDVSLFIYSVLLLGGTRSGKTWIGLRLFVAFVIAVPQCRAWAVQEVDVERADEIETELDELLPDSWFVKTGSKYKCANGSVITIRSAKYPQKLKRGRCDIAFVNEAQNIEKAAFDMLRMRTSDTSGLVLMAANPPNDNPVGQHIADYAEECEAGRRPHGKTFHFVHEDNPHINRDQLKALESETDPRTYAIEVMGKVLPPSNAVMHAFSVIENIAPTPELAAHDVTTHFLKRCGLGDRVTDFVGLDFQRTPHMAAVAGRAFLNPADPDKPLLYYRDEVIVELGDEHDLSDGLYDHGLDPATTVLIGDASGDWQDADRTKGSSSYDILRKCGWRRIFRPDRTLKVNPPVHERTKNDNRLFCAQDGSHIVIIDPRCVALIAACKEWRRKAGIPNKRSKHAHIGEAMSYANWRLYPRRQGGHGVEYKRLKGRRRPGQMRRF